MQESDVQLLGAKAGSGVNQAYALAFNLYEGFLHAVLYAEGYVVNTLVAFLQPLGDRTLGACALEELELDFSAAQERCLNFLVGYLLSGIMLQTKNFREVGQCCLNAFHGDTEVLNV